MEAKDKFTIHKHFNRWEVYVPANTIAVIPFVAPFKTFKQAVSYVNYGLRKLSS